MSLLLINPKLDHAGAKRSEQRPVYSPDDHLSKPEGPQYACLGQGICQLRCCFETSAEGGAIERRGAVTKISVDILQGDFDF